MNYELRIMEGKKSKILTFTDLHAWQEAHKLVLGVYKITKRFPSDEIFGLVSQMRRAAISITSNIAEGFSRQSYREKVQFYSIAQGSLTELQSQFLVAKDIGYVPIAEYEAILQQSVVAHKLVNGLIRSSKNQS